MTLTQLKAACGAALLLTVATLVHAADAAPGSKTAQIVYPATPRGTQTDNYFGTVVSDPYRWLEDDNSPQTKDWVARENAVTQDWLKRVPFRGAVLERLRAISNYAKYSAPFTKNGLVFFYKNDGLQNQSVLHVQQGMNGTPQMLLDPNTFSPDGTVRLTSFTLSRDGRYAAYEKTAIPGSDWRDVYVMDMQTRRTLPEVLHWIKFSETAWRGDGFYYSRFPTPAPGSELTAPIEHQQAWYHRIGSAQSDDVLVYEDSAHPSYMLGVATTEDERYATLSIGDRTKRGNALFVRDERGAKALDAPFKPIVGEIGEDRFDVVDNQADRLFVVTTRQAPNRQLLRYDIADASWTTVLPERQQLLENVVAAGGHLFATYLQDVAARVEVVDHDGRLRDRIALPGPGSTRGFGGQRGDKQVFYIFSSMNQPPSIFRYDIAGKRSSLFRAPEIPGFDAARFESKQFFFKSRDGTRIPMFLVYRKGLALDGRNPTILYGYGGFNVTLNPYFSATRIAWLEQGGVFAMANLRGGGEYGEAWHEAGMRLKKQNVFDDCIAAAEYLINEKYTAPDRLALQGGSNGGLLVGAVLNQRPDLFKVALPQVGVMDMLRFQKFSAGPAWISDYGSSDDETQFKNLMTYSPLQNIKAGVNYPATLVTTSDHDDRVVPAHSFKYIATLQALSGGDAPHLIRIETNSGHGSSNLSKALEEAADAYSFVWANMGIVPTYVH